MNAPSSISKQTLFARVGSAALVVAAALFVAPNGCLQGGEGDRCNPDLAPGEDECGMGLSCQQPQYCPEAYCCPKAGESTSPFCQPGCAGGQASICDAGGDADCNGPNASDGGGD
jgi:hypothetical protein